MGGYFQQISDDYFPDRILEAEKICDKHEMEQFPNEGDDLQVLIVDNGTQLSWMIFLEIILKFSNRRQSSNLLLHGSWPPWSSGRSTFLTSKSFPLKTRLTIHSWSTRFSWHSWKTRISFLSLGSWHSIGWLPSVSLLSNWTRETWGTNGSCQPCLSWKTLIDRN